jgi:hypothetical protein
MRRRHEHALPRRARDRIARGTFDLLHGAGIHADYLYNVGPHTPKYQYQGDTADTAALEAWIAATLPK